jgi:DNA processing protein
MQNYKIQKTKIKIGKDEKEVYYRGNWNNSIFKKSIAIVGSRRMTRYGKEIIDRFVSIFIANGITTISGFMYGVDTEVHQKTVEYGGKTVAIFGCGLDIIYPPENEKLYKKILETDGLVISEYEPDAKPHLWKFPQRNKIIAGLASLGVLIVEAAEKSGSLITADIARKMGKKVYAVPGPITSSISVGTNQLIKEKKAILVTEPRDVIGKISKLKKSKTQNDINLSKLESKIYEVLRAEPLNVDEIAVQIGENIIEVGTTLSLMGIKGLIIESAGKFYLNRS